MSGWVKLHRQVLDSSLWQNPNAFLVFTYLLLRAAHVPKKFPFNGKDIDLQAGELISSHDSIRVGLTGSLSIQKIRTALEYLKSTDRITVKTTNKFSIISITKWDEYQSDNRQDNKPVTNEQQASNKPVTTNKNIKNEKKEKNEKNIRNPLTPCEGDPVWPQSIDTPETRQEWNRWLTYKHAKRSVYKTLDSHEAALRRCAKVFQTPERMIAAIEYSISQGWSGIYEEKKTTGGKQQELSGVVGPNGYEYSEAFLYNLERSKRLREEEENEKSRTK